MSGGMEGEVLDKAEPTDYFSRIEIPMQLRRKHLTNFKNGIF